MLDELDLPFATLRLRERGSAGGHNGLTSVIQQVGSNEIPRLRVGIGRGRSNAKTQVLSKFSPDEQRELPFVIDRAVKVDLKNGELIRSISILSFFSFCYEAAYRYPVGIKFYLNAQFS